MEKGGALEGVVVDGNGAAVHGAQVLVRDYGEGIEERRGVSDAQGRFAFSNIVSKDKVDVEVSHNDFSTWSAEGVDVGSTDLEVRLTPHGGFAGSVFAPDGEAVMAFTVQPQADRSQRSGGKRLRAKTFNDGTFEYTGVPAGTYTLHIRSLKFSAVTIEDVRIGEGEIRDLGEIVLQEGGNVTGRVIDANNGVGVGGARVRVTQGARAFQPGKAVSTIMTAADGSFTITGLKDQVITLEVSHADFAPQRKTGVDPRIAQRSQGLVIELVSAGEIVGAVGDATGKALKGVSVYLISQGKGAARGSNQTVSTDADGSFHFRRVAPGFYTVKAHMFGSPPRSSETKVTVESGGTLEVNLTLD